MYTVNGWQGKLFVGFVLVLKAQEVKISLVRWNVGRCAYLGSGKKRRAQQIKEPLWNVRHPRRLGTHHIRRPQLSGSAFLYFYTILRRRLFDLSPTATSHQRWVCHWDMSLVRRGMFLPFCNCVSLFLFVCLPKPARHPLKVISTWGRPGFPSGAVTISHFLHDPHHRVFAFSTVQNRNCFMLPVFKWSFSTVDLPSDPFSLTSSIIRTGQF